MAITKVEAAKLTSDMLLRGVIQTIVKESMLLQMLPFMQVIGSAVVYNREATMPAAAFYDVGDTWTEATPTFTKITAVLRILGGDADVDNFLQKTYSSINDIQAEVIMARAKSVAHAYLNGFYNGSNTTDPKSFDGIQTAIPAGQTIAAGTNGGTLTLDMMDNMLDLVKPGRADAILVSKRTRRRLSALRRTSGTLIESDVNQFGQHVTYYDGIPLIVDDFISETQTKGTSAAVCSSAYAVKLGPQGVMGLENGGITVENVGQLETKDAVRTRIKWYAGLAVMSELGVAKIEGILP